MTSGRVAAALRLSNAPVASYRQRSRFARRSVQERLAVTSPALRTVNDTVGAPEGPPALPEKLSVAVVALSTTTETGTEALELPARSCATAWRVREPGAAPVVSQSAE